MLRALPDFVVIGAQKSGTSSLYAYLTRHPQVYPARRKEIHFFDQRFDRGVGWYRSHFPLRARLGRSGLTGEATPYLLFHPGAPARVRSVVPDAMLIAVLRNPVDRAYSHYWHARCRGFETLSFEDAVEAERARLEDDADGFAHQRLSYLSRGDYFPQLTRWFEQFPRSQFVVVPAERLFGDPRAVTDSVLERLGLGPCEPADWPVFNEGTKDAPMSEPTRSTLRAHFEPGNARLYDLVGEDFGWDGAQVPQGDGWASRRRD